MFVQVLFWVLSIPVTVVVTVLLGDPVRHVVLRIIAPWRGAAPNVRGQWCSTGTYAHDPTRIVGEHIVQLRQVGDYVVGRNAPGEHFYFMLHGRLRSSNYFTGTWESLKDLATTALFRRSCTHGVTKCMESGSALTKKT
jgi:hypothetical protein